MNRQFLDQAKKLRKLYKRGIFTKAVYTAQRVALLAEFHDVWMRYHVICHYLGGGKEPPAWLELAWGNDIPPVEVR